MMKVVGGVVTIAIGIMTSYYFDNDNATKDELSSIEKKVELISLENKNLIRQEKEREESFAIDGLVNLISLMPSNGRSSFFSNNSKIYKSYKPGTRLNYKNDVCMPGVHIKSQQNLYFHHGVCLGDGKVIARSRKYKGVKVVTISEFGHEGKGLVSVVESPKNRREAKVILKRVKYEVKHHEKGYKLFTDNCEHFATKVFSGHANSFQVQSGMKRVKNIMVGTATGAVVDKLPSPLSVTTKEVGGYVGDHYKEVSGIKKNPEVTIVKKSLLSSVKLFSKNLIRSIF